MAVTVLERKVDEKRRVTLPPSLDVKEGDRVTLIVSSGAAVVASDRQVAVKLCNMLRELEKERKYKAIEEWTKMVEEAGLTDLRARDIDRLVDEGISDEAFGRGRKKGSD